jgi:TolB-like protein
MKPWKYLFFVGLAISLWSINAAESFDSQMTGFAQKLATQIQASGRKKVAVLDFADLQGNQTDLGRYIAEQLTVNLVEVRTNFNVVDRANLKRILDEHKLTISGLIEPDNAKKLGQISGVDALVLGNVIPLANDVQFTAKVIATDSAEIVGAAKVRVTKDEEIKALIARTPEAPQSKPTNAGGSTVAAAQTNSQVRPKPSVNVDELTKIDKNSQRLGEVFVKIESLRFTQPQVYRSQVLVTAVFVNMNASTPISVALNGETSSSFIKAASKVVNARGDEFLPIETTGVSRYSEGREWGSKFGDLTEIPPGGSAKTTIKYEFESQKGGDYKPYRIQAEIFVGHEEQGRIVSLKKHNLLIDFDSSR